MNVPFTFKHFIHTYMYIYLVIYLRIQQSFKPTIFAACQSNPTKNITYTPPLQHIFTHCHCCCRQLAYKNTLCITIVINNLQTHTGREQKMHVNFCTGATRRVFGLVSKFLYFSSFFVMLLLSFAARLKNS